MKHSQLKKNKIFISLLVLFGAFIFFAPLSYAYNIEDNEGEYMFIGNDDVVRGFIWGLTPELIRAPAEKGTFIGKEVTEGDTEVAFFIDKIWGIRHTIGYEFDENRKLWRVRLFNEKEYHYPQGRMEDLLTLQNYFTERYGPPVEENFFWKNNEQFNKVENWGWALYRGNLRVDMLWQSEESNIRISLKSPEPLNPEFTIVFEDRSKVDELNVIEIEAQKPKPLIPRIEFDE